MEHGAEQDEDGDTDLENNMKSGMEQEIIEHDAEQDDGFETERRLKRSRQKLARDLERHGFEPLLKSRFNNKAEEEKALRVTAMRTGSTDPLWTDGDIPLLDLARYSRPILFSYHNAILQPTSRWARMYLELAQHPKVLEELNVFLQACPENMVWRPVIRKFRLYMQGEVFQKMGMHPSAEQIQMLKDFCEDEERGPGGHHVWFVYSCSEIAGQGTWPSLDPDEFAYVLLEVLEHLREEKKNGAPSGKDAKGIGGKPRMEVEKFFTESVTVDPRNLDYKFGSLPRVEVKNVLDDR